jgi:NADH dehydrogenase (ubiquinone) 1 alpha subcomplex subunit 13
MFLNPSAILKTNGFSHLANSELAREKMWARIHLIPLLQAEEDRDQVRRYLADQAREKELLGENAKVYHSDRFVSPLLPVVSVKSGFTETTI